MKDGLQSRDAGKGLERVTKKLLETSTVGKRTYRAA